MPVTFEFRDGVVVLEMRGKYEPEDIKDALLTALRDSRSSAAAGLLFDMSESVSIKDRTAADVTAMGYFLAGESHRFGRRAALVAERDFTFGMMRLGQTVLEGLGVAAAVFRSAAEADLWIRRRPPPPPTPDSVDQPVADSR